MFLLLLGPECVDHGPDHVDAEGERLRRWPPLRLLEEDVLPHRVPSGAAILGRPVWNGPSLFVKDARPQHKVVLVHMLAVDQLLPDFRRQPVLQESAYLVPERQFLVGVAKIHLVLLGNVSRFS